MTDLQRQDSKTLLKVLLATTKRDKDFVPLCLPPWVIPLSMAVLIL